MLLQFIEKALLFHKLNPYSKWKRGLSPLFQPFFPLQPDFFLNQAAVLGQSQGTAKCAVPYINEVFL